MLTGTSRIQPCSPNIFCQYTNQSKKVGLEARESLLVRSVGIATVCTEKRVAAQQFLDPPDDLLRVQLRHYATGAGVAGSVTEMRGKVHREHNNRSTGGLRADLPCGTQPVHHRHGKVHDDHVGRQLLCLMDSVETVAGFPADLPPIMLTDKVSELLTKKEVVINDENTRRLPLYFCHESHARTSTATIEVLS